MNALVVVVLGALAAEEPVTLPPAEPPVLDEVPAPAAEAPSPADPRLRVMVPDLRCPDQSVDEGGVEALTGLTVLQLSKVPRFSVISGAEIAEMLRVEAEKQVLGCDESTSCLSEIADAMDARLLVTGTVVRVGPRVVVNLSLVDSSSVEVVGRSRIDVRAAEEMPYELRRAVHEMTAPYGGLPGYTPRDDAPTSVGRLVSRAANHPDIAALFCTTGLGLCSFALPCVPCVPAAQGLALAFGGKDIAGREYPLWWLGTVAGYGALIGGVTAGVAVFAWSQTATDNALINNSIAFGGGALAFGSIFVLEPLAVWATSLLLARDWQPPVVEAASEEVPLEPREAALRPVEPASPSAY